MDSIEALGNSARETDRLALKIYRLLQSRSAEDRRVVLLALKSDSEVLAPRAHLVRCAIERFENECGTKVSKQRYEKWRVESDDRSLPSATFIARTHGGTWSKAMDAVGKQPALDHAAFRLRARGRSPGKEEVLETLSVCARELGVDHLRFRDYRSWAIKKQPHLSGGVNLLVSKGSFTSRFGSFTQACVLAGLAVPPGYLGPWAGPTRYTDEAAITALVRAQQELGEVGAITQAEYVEWRKTKYTEAAASGELVSFPSYLTIRNIFGSWVRALYAAGMVSEKEVDNYSRGQGMKMSPETVAEGLLRAVESLGPKFTVRAYAEWRVKEITSTDLPRPPSVTLLKKAFKRWPIVLEQVCIALEQEDSLNALAAVVGDKYDGK